MIRVEFFGIPRMRTGAAFAEVEDARTLGDLLRELTARFPALADDCVIGGQLSPHCKVNFDGNQFVSNPNASLANVKSVLLLSADAGG